MSRTIAALVIAAGLAQIGTEAVAEESKTRRDFARTETTEAEAVPMATFAPTWPAWAEKVQQAIAPQCKPPSGALYAGCEVTVQLQHQVNGKCISEGAPRVVYDACWHKANN